MQSDSSLKLVKKILSAFYPPYPFIVIGPRNLSIDEFYSAQNVEAPKSLISIYLLAMFTLGSFPTSPFTVLEPQNPQTVGNFGLYCAKLKTGVQDSDLRLHYARAAKPDDRQIYGVQKQQSTDFEILNSRKGR